MLETKECINQQCSFKSGHLVFLQKNDVCVLFSYKYIWKFIFYFFPPLTCQILVLYSQYSTPTLSTTPPCKYIHVHIHTFTRICTFTCFLFLPNLRQLFPINTDLAVNQVPLEIVINSEIISKCLIHFQEKLVHIL